MEADLSRFGLLAVGVGLGFMMAALMVQQSWVAIGAVLPVLGGATALTYVQRAILRPNGRIEVIDGVYGLNRVKEVEGLLPIRRSRMGEYALVPHRLWLPLRPPHDIDVRGLLEWAERHGRRVVISDDDDAASDELA